MPTCHGCGAELQPSAAFCSACGARASAPAGPGSPLTSHIFHYVPHPHIENRKRRAPKSTGAQPEPQGPFARFNAFLAVKITNGVGTMWCAYVFAGIALISLPEAIRGGTSPLIAWIAQTFLQLVLLSIIIVGQKVEGATSEKRAIDTYKDAEALLAEVIEIQKHLLAQDAWLQQLILSHGGREPQPEQPGAPGPRT
jgi:hypothetical protein